MRVLQCFLVFRLMLLIHGYSFLYEHIPQLRSRAVSDIPSTRFRRRESLSEPHANARSETLLDHENICKLEILITMFALLYAKHPRNSFPCSLKSKFSFLLPRPHFNGHLDPRRPPPRCFPNCVKPTTKELTPQNDGQLHCGVDTVHVRAPNKLYGVYPNLGGAQIMCHQRVKCQKMKVVKKFKDVPKHHVDACVLEGECTCQGGTV